MPDYNWPPENDRVFIGKRISRIDAPFKVSGRAKYTYDANSQGRLYGKILRSPYAHAKIVSIDVSAAEKMPGVKAVHIIQAPGTTIFWAGDCRYQRLHRGRCGTSHQSRISKDGVPGSG